VVPVVEEGVERLEDDVEELHGRVRWRPADGHFDHIDVQSDLWICDIDLALCAQD
jgi:hypothetical protein